MPIDRIQQEFEVRPRRGLSEGQVRERRAQYGPNRLRQAAHRSAWTILLSQFKSVVIIVLVFAGGVAFAFRHWAEGLAIVAVLVINAAIGFFTEWKAVRSMEALRSMGGDTTRVRRDGEDTEIDIEQLVPGDIVILESGDIAPADIRVSESNGLRVSEAALTGESVPVHKNTAPVAVDAVPAERICMVYKGTTVAGGSGEGIVTATGMDTELGRISELTAAAEKETTPLQVRLDQLGRRLAWITLVIAGAVLGMGLLAGRDPRHMIETAIALGVAAIPEGLPIVATIALARGMHLMARRNALIRKLPAVETLGSTRVIFTDKTGTLTENRMTLRQVSTPAGDFSLDEEERRVLWMDGRPDGGEAADNLLLRRSIEIGVLCNNAAVRDLDRDERPDEEQGDPTETALLRAGYIFGLHRQDLLERMPEAREVPFDSDRMMMATYHRAANGFEVAVKGAAGRVLAACNRRAGGNGAAESPLSEEERQHWIRQAERIAAEGLRLLAVADKAVVDTTEEPYRDLRFLGLLGLADPPRRDVREALEQCRSAGIRVIMVTGDQPATAAAIARQTGLSTAEKPAVVHGSRLQAPERLDSQERRRVLRTEIFARVSPEQKFNLIGLMQSEGLTVAMTGDGVNDTPALKKADIGIAMGRRGTDAAREVADMVLLDDSFATIVAAVRQGRVIFRNIRKSVVFMLCTNVAEVIAVAVAAVLGGFTPIPIPLLPLQILYLNVVTDVFPALALGLGGGGPGVMRQKPRPREEPVLTRRHWLAVGGWSILLSGCVLGAVAAAFILLGLDEVRAVTISFLTLAFGKLWFVFNLRSPGSRLIRNEITANPYVAAAILLCIGLLLAAVYVPVLSGVLQTDAPGSRGWALIMGLSLIPFVVGQLIRIVQRAARTAAPRNTPKHPEK